MLAFKAIPTSNYLSNDIFLQFTFKMTLLETAGGTSFDAMHRYAPI